MPIGKETGRLLRMVMSMYLSTTLLGDSKDFFGGLPIDELNKKADGFLGVFPGKHDNFHKLLHYTTNHRKMIIYESRLQFYAIQLEQTKSEE